MQHSQQNSYTTHTKILLYVPWYTILYNKQFTYSTTLTISLITCETTLYISSTDTHLSVLVNAATATTSKIQKFYHSSTSTKNKFYLDQWPHMSHTPRIPSDVSDFHNELVCLPVINDLYLTQSIGNLAQLLLYIYDVISLHPLIYIWTAEKNQSTRIPSVWELDISASTF